MHTLFIKLAGAPVEVNGVLKCGGVSEDRLHPRDSDGKVV